MITTQPLQYHFVELVDIGHYCLSSHQLVALPRHLQRNIERTSEWLKTTGE